MPQASATRSRLRRRQASAHCPCGRVAANLPRCGHRGQCGARSWSYMPHSSRSTLQISPIVQRARSASRSGGNRFSVPRRGGADGRQRRVGGFGVAFGPHAGGALALTLLAFRVDRVQLDRQLRLGRVRVDADDHPLARLDLLLPAERGALDLALHETPLDSLDGAAERVDALDQLPGARFELVRQRLDVERAAERVGGVGRACLALQDLLRAQRDRRRVLRRQRECFVERVGVNRLRAAARGRQRLHRDAHDVVLGLLRSQGRAAGLRVESQGQRLRVRRAEPLAHDPRPQPPCRAELRDLLEEVVVRVEEEGQARTEVVGRQAGSDRRGAVGDAVGEREGKLLHCSRSGLADVVAGDRDRVPGRDPLRAVREQIGRQPHRRARREDVVPARDVLLEDVVLHGAAKRGARHTVLLRHQLVQQQQQRRRCVDRHRRRYIAERDPGEQQLHVGERVDRHAGAADLAERPRIVRVVAELGRQVERDRQAGLAAFEQVAVARVRLLGRGKPRVLADRPRPPAVHVGVRAARVRILARQVGSAPGRPARSRPASPRSRTRSRVGRSRPRQDHRYDHADTLRP